MQGSERRQAILDQLKASEQALSANKLATAFQVSRQIIVGDIALLRASGLEIVATSKGYILPDVNFRRDAIAVSKWHQSVLTRPAASFLTRNLKCDS